MRKTNIRRKYMTKDTKNYINYRKLEIVGNLLGCPTTTSHLNNFPGE